MENLIKVYIIIKGYGLGRPKKQGKGIKNEGKG